MPVYYPLEVYDERIFYSLPISEDTMTILSFYNKTSINYMDSKDIMYMFSTVPPMLWLEVLLSYIAFIAVLWFGHRLLDRDKRSDSIWMTTIAFLGQDNFPENRKYISLLSLIMCTGRERTFRK